MGSGNDLVPMVAATAQIPIAQMRHLYRMGDVEKRLDKLPAREHETLRATYERMLEKGPERFQRWTTCTTSYPTSMTCSTT